MSDNENNPGNRAVKVEVFVRKTVTSDDTKSDFESTERFDIKTIDGVEEFCSVVGWDCQRDLQGQVIIYTGVEDPDSAEPLCQRFIDYLLMTWKGMFSYGNCEEVRRSD